MKKIGRKVPYNNLPLLSPQADIEAKPIFREINFFSRPYLYTESS